MNSAELRRRWAHTRCTLPHDPMNCSGCALVAALERLEALEKPRTAVVTCPECGYVALADIPAPAGQQGGSDD